MTSQVMINKSVSTLALVVFDPVLASLFLDDVHDLGLLSLLVFDAFNYRY